MLKQPSTNVKMTNVATIRYKINNKIFEIACYRNKAMNWRNGVEEDIAQVLQIEEIYENASHGTLAKKAELNKFFPNKTKKEIIEIILDRGELQISDKERQNQQSGILAQIIKIIVQKCVHPVTKRRFTPDAIRQAIKDIHFPLKTDQLPKKQALDCIKLLQKNYKIARGEMRIRINFQKVDKQKIQEELKALQIFHFESEEEKGSQLSRIYNIEPNKYRQLNQMCKKIDKVTVQVLVGVIVNSQYKQLESEQFSALEPLDELKEKREHQQKQQKKEEIPLKIQEKVSGEKTIKCTTCGQTAVFGTAQDQRLHFKTEWHVENVKRKSKNLHPLSQEDYKVENFNKNYQ